MCILYIFNWLGKRRRSSKKREKKKKASAFTWLSSSKSLKTNGFSWLHDFCFSRSENSSSSSICLLLLHVCSAKARTTCASFFHFYCWLFFSRPEDLKRERAMAINWLMNCHQQNTQQEEEKKYVSQKKKKNQFRRTLYLSDYLGCLIAGDGYKKGEFLPFLG